MLDRVTAALGDGEARVAAAAKRAEDPASRLCDRRPLVRARLPVRVALKTCTCCCRCNCVWQTLARLTRIRTSDPSARGTLRWTVRTCVCRCWPGQARLTTTSFLLCRWIAWNRQCFRRGRPRALQRAWQTRGCATRSASSASSVRDIMNCCACEYVGTGTGGRRCACVHGQCHWRA